MKHLKYLKYVLIHKYWVFVAGLHLGVPLWQLITHDWSKFTPKEWFAYVNHFYGNYPKFDPEDTCKYVRQGYYGITTKETKEMFDVAWNYHQKTQPHHWQFWVLITDSDEPRTCVLPMPQKYVLEMVADWAGAGKAITGKWEFEAWFLKNKDVYLLEDSTLYRVQQAIQKLKGKLH
jgi:hypothetical protein